jgi:hypothetical protein
VNSGQSSLGSPYFVYHWKDSELQREDDPCFRQDGRWMSLKGHPGWANILIYKSEVESAPNTDSARSLNPTVKLGVGAYKLLNLSATNKALIECGR